MEGFMKVGFVADFSARSKQGVAGVASHLKSVVCKSVGRGDHLILVNIRPEADSEGGMNPWRSAGSPLFPLSEFRDPIIMKKLGINFKLEPKILQVLDLAARHKGISVFLKIYWGDHHDKMNEAIRNIPLRCCFAIGNGGLGKMKGE